MKIETLKDRIEKAKEMINKKEKNNRLNFIINVILY